jgi:hypothetical protein
MFAAKQMLPKNSVGSKQIKEGAVTAAKLGDGAVTGAKIGAGAVTGAKIAPGSIGGADLNLATLGPVPNATHAGSPDSAAEAQDSARLGGVAAGEFAHMTAQPGEVLRPDRCLLHPK